ncbi:MAG: ammonia-forming cytochrome c nitrite reductase subunit c552 [Opitutales bacterium]
MSHPDELAASDSQTPPARSRKYLLPSIVFAVIGLATFGVAALLVTIFEHQQDAKRPYVELVEVTEVSTDPVPWGTNWPFQFDSYRRSVDIVETQYGGSSAMPASKLEEEPWLRRLYAGYAFSLDYREARGHAYMLYDQEVTERVTQRTQSGACLHCHASVVPTYRRLGMLERGENPTPEKLAESFNWPAVMEGFRVASTMNYSEAHAELLKTPDGTPSENLPLFPGGSTSKRPTPANVASEPPKPAPDPENPHMMGEAHPVSCIDCHAPGDMAVRVTRPGFVLGIAKLAESDDPVPHLPSINRWREGPRDRPYDPNIDATRQEMRSFTCAQCHVEYYCASKETLFFPWDKGLKVEQIEAAYEAHDFPDGEDFYDWEHGETGARLYKAQHPEFELWSQGVHARSGVSCADCHMPYERQGAAKVSRHWVRSPMLNLNNACQTCHNVPEAELRDKVTTIQGRTKAMMHRAADAMTDMLDAIRQAQSAGVDEDQLERLFELQKKAMWRLDFISSENSMGFHADQEAVRILGESIDYSRQAQALAVALRAPEPPELTDTTEPVRGVTPSGKAPPAPYTVPGTDNANTIGE